MNAKEAYRLTKLSIPSVIEREIKSLSDKICNRASDGYFFLEHKNPINDETVAYFQENGYDVEITNTSKGRIIQISWEVVNENESEKS